MWSRAAACKSSSSKTRGASETLDSFRHHGLVVGGPFGMKGLQGLPSLPFPSRNEREVAGMSEPVGKGSTVPELGEGISWRLGSCCESMSRSWAQDSVALFLRPSHRTIQARGQRLGLAHSLRIVGCQGNRFCGHQLGSYANELLACSIPLRPEHRARHGELAIIISKLSILGFELCKTLQHQCCARIFDIIAPAHVSPRTKSQLLQDGVAFRDVRRAGRLQIASR